MIAFAPNRCTYGQANHSPDNAEIVQVKLHAPAHLLRAERQRNIFAGTHERILNSTAADISVACAKRHPDIVDVR
jgi:hypothetical protein